MRRHRNPDEGGAAGLLHSPLSRRGLLLGAGGIAAAAALAACDKSSTGSASGGSSASSAPGGPLTVWASTTFAGTTSTALAQAAQEYGSKHNSTITVQGFPANDLTGKITTALGGGSGPDIVIVDAAQVPVLAAAKLLVDISSRFNSVKSQFFPGNVAATTYNGATYAVPFDTNNVALFYNKQLFSKAGIANPPSTWDDLRSAAKELTGGNQYGYMLGAKGYGSFLYWPWLWQNGGQIVDSSNAKAAFNSSEGMEAWKFYSGLYLNDKVVPPTFLGVTQAWDQYIQPFLTGQVAMMAIGDWGIAPIAKGNPSLEYGVAPLPKGKQAATVLGGNAVAVTSAAKNPDAAWAFVSWLTAKEQEHVLEDGYKRIPARLDVAGSSFSSADPARKVFSDQAAVAKSRPPTAKWNSVEWGVMADAWDSVIQKKKAPEQALNEAAEGSTKALSGS
jgi:multiple sugar transport system substrate-binding protein